MNYQQACSKFGVTDTRRQRTKWGKRQGRAFKLSNALGSQITTRIQQASMARAENEQIRRDNEDLDEDDRRPLITILPNYEDADVCRVLGQ